MELYRLGIKFFADGETIELTEFIPVFHEWIQKQVIDGHLLIDVHDYSHMQDGPGILLVAHQGNFTIDSNSNGMGLLYYRKQPAESLADIVKPAVQGCRLLEDDPRVRGRVRFALDEAIIVANDRLLAPNTDESFSQLQPPLSATLRQVLGKTFKLARISEDPKERLAIRAMM
ncbi:MAG TPA: hypothetical protein VLL56_09280 [Terriglobia bacterium]|nr:hypothetical protein [Terriglobia bacterium]